MRLPTTGDPQGPRAVPEMSFHLAGDGRYGATLESPAAEAEAVDGLDRPERSGLAQVHHSKERPQQAGRTHPRGACAFGPKREFSCAPPS